MTPEEAKKMEGTEFIYVYEDGDTIQAFVKKYDPKIGLTCLTLETESRMGHRGQKQEADGTWCVVALDFMKEGRKAKKKALRWLEKIRDTGQFTGQGLRPSNSDSSSPVCVFS